MSCVRRSTRDGRFLYSVCAKGPLISCSRRVGTRFAWPHDEAWQRRREREKARILELNRCGRDAFECVSNSRVAARVNVADDGFSPRQQARWAFSATRPDRCLVSGDADCHLQQDCYMTGSDCDMSLAQRTSMRSDSSMPQSAASR